MNRTITIGNGHGTKKSYYYWGSFGSWEEALEVAKEMKYKKQNKGERIKYFILEISEGNIFPIKRFVVYFDRKLT